MTEWTDKERKILDTFLDGETIRQLPARQKKRLVVLRWLLEHFERDRRYGHAELNAMIKMHHPDSAAIRREWIEHGMMNRDQEAYWRVDCVD